MPQITISFPNVLVDGKSDGKVADTIANNPKLASDIQRALEAERAQLEEVHAVQLTEERANCREATEELQRLRAEQQRLVTLGLENADDHEKLKAVLSEAAKPEKDRQREALEAQRADIEEKLKSL